MKMLKRILMIIIMVFILVCGVQIPLQAQKSKYSTTQSFKNVRVAKGEKKYGSSLLLKGATVEELVKILEQYSGKKMPKVHVSNKEFDVELFFEEKNAAKRLVWFARNGTAKTYYEHDEKIPSNKIKVMNRDIGMNLYIDDKDEEISVEFKKTKLPDLLLKLSELTGIKFQIEEGLKLDNILVDMVLKKVTIDEVVLALSKLEDLELTKINKRLYKVTRKQ